MASIDSIFEPVSTGRVSTEIVDQIERAIDAGQLTIGDRLPSERDLTERFGVSRTTVRDALRILEAQGLIEVRLGARGGAFVTAPEPAQVSATLGRMLMFASVEPAELEEARRVLELAVIDLACRRVTDDDIEALSAICDEAQASIAAGDFDVRLSVRFHARLARAAHNRALDLLLNSFQGAVLLTLMRARDATPTHGLRGLAEHRQLIEALGTGDQPAASKIMRDHLARTARARRNGA